MCQASSVSFARSCEIKAKKTCELTSDNQVRHQAVVSRACARKRARIAEQANIVVHAENDRAQFEGDLLGIRLRSQVAFINRLAHGSCKLPTPFHQTSQHSVAHRTRAIVVFDRAAD